MVCSFGWRSEIMNLDSAHTVCGFPSPPVFRRDGMVRRAFPLTANFLSRSDKTIPSRHGSSGVIPFHMNAVRIHSVASASCRDAFNAEIRR